MFRSPKMAPVVVVHLPSRPRIFTISLVWPNSTAFSDDIWLILCMLLGSEYVRITGESGKNPCKTYKKHIYCEVGEKNESKR